MKKITLLILCGIFLTLLLLEIVLRALPVSTGLAYQPTTLENPILHGKPYYRYVFSEGWNLRMMQRGRLNNVGYPADTDYQIDKRNFVVIGDSFVEALMIPAPARLQAQLENDLHHKVSVYGLGRSGSELGQYLGVAQWAANTLKSDRFIYNLVAGDIENAAQKKPGEYYLNVTNNTCELLHSDRRGDGRLLRLVKTSALYHYFFYNLKFVDAFTRLLPSESHTHNLEQALTPLNTAISQCFLHSVEKLTSVRKNHIIFIVNADQNAIYNGKPPPYRDIDLFAEEAEKIGFPVVRLQSIFEREYALSKTSFDFKPIDSHWNEHAHQLAAMAVAEKIRSLHLLQDETMISP